MKLIWIQGILESLDSQDKRSFAKPASLFQTSMRPPPTLQHSNRYHHSLVCHWCLLLAFKLENRVDVLQNVTILFTFSVKISHQLVWRKKHFIQCSLQVFSKVTYFLFYWLFMLSEQCRTHGLVCTKSHNFWTGQLSNDRPTIPSLLTQYGWKHPQIKSII